MTRDLVIVGSGGFGREVADIVAAINTLLPEPQWNMLGYLDDAPSLVNVERAERQGLSVLGPVSADTVDGTPHFVIGISDGIVRKKLADRLEAAGWKPATLIHPAAGIGSETRIGEGTILCAGVQITTNVTLGRHVHLNLNCTVGHDTELRDFVSVNPLVAVSGEILLEEQATVGSSAFILQGLSVGRAATIGASACVTRDVPAEAIVKGVPAR